MNKDSNETLGFENQFPLLGNHVYIAPNATIIGSATLDDNVSVWPMAVIRADVNQIKIGESTNVQDAAILHVTHDGPYTPGGSPLVIGRGVTIGHQAVLHACTIGNYCLIGIGAILLDKVIVEDNVIVGAGSLVSPGKRLKSGYLYMGSPAREVRKLTDDELDNLKYSAEHYVRLKDKYLRQL